MAVTLVQHNSATASVTSSGTITTSPASFSCSFSSNNTAGNQIVAIWGLNGPNPQGTGLAGNGTMSDSRNGAIYTRAFEAQKGFAGQPGLSLWFANNILGGANTVTFNYDLDSQSGTNTGSVWLAVFEFSGLNGAALQGQQEAGFSGGLGGLSVTDSQGVSLTIGNLNNGAWGLVDLSGGGYDHVMLCGTTTNSPGSIAPTITPSSYGALSLIEQPAGASGFGYLVAYDMGVAPIYSRQIQQFLLPNA